MRYSDSHALCAQSEPPLTSSTESSSPRHSNSESCSQEDGLLNVVFSIADKTKSSRLVESQQLHLSSRSCLHPLSQDLAYAQDSMGLEQHCNVVAGEVLQSAQICSAAADHKLLELEIAETRDYVQDSGVKTGNDEVGVADDLHCSNRPIARSIRALDSKTSRDACRAANRCLWNAQWPLRVSCGHGLWRRVLFRITLAVAAIGFVGSIALNAACSYFDLFFNVSESLPYGLYKVTYLNESEGGAFEFSARGLDFSFEYGARSNAVLAHGSDADNAHSSDSSLSHSLDTGVARRLDIGEPNGLDTGMAHSSEAGKAHGGDARKAHNLMPSMAPSADTSDGHGVTKSILALQRGQVVLMCLPDSVAQMAYERDYIASGKCKGGVAPVGKHIIALAGDRVKFNDEGVYVNGHLVPDSAPYAADGAGRELPQMRTSDNVYLADGELVVLNSFAGSFDSRYFGAVPITQVIGTLSPLLVFS